MIVGGIFVILSQFWFGILGHMPGIALMFGVFGGMIFLIGFALWKWENSAVGRKVSSGNEGKSVPGDRSVAIIPPPRHLPTFDHDSGRRLCSFFLYDVDNRLPCLSGCEYPDAKHGTCTREMTIPTCPYPNSREPIVKALMPKPVAWCPGPGGCKHFNELEYLCGLKLKGLQAEFLYSFSRKSHNRNIGKVLIILGALPIFIPIIDLVLNIGLEFQTMALLPGVFIAAIGGVVYHHAD